MKILILGSYGTFGGRLARLLTGEDRLTLVIAGGSFSSTREAGGGRFEHLLCERFGPCVFDTALVIDGDRMWLVLRRWSFFGVPLPISWAPFGDCFEHVKSGLFCFRVEISHPLTEPIVNYRGWLAPQETAADSARQAAPNPALVRLGVETPL